MPQKSSACDACHRRKVQCYGSPPPCTRCKHHSIPCTFDRPNRTASRTRISSGGHISNESLNQRIERIERALSVAQKSSRLSEGFSASERTPSVTPQASSYKPDFSSRVRFHFAGQFVGLLGSFTGIPFISASGRAWIQERTGQKESVDKICSIGPDWHASLEQTNPLRQTTEGLNSLQLSGKSPDLPARRTVEHIFALYCSTCFSSIFFLVEPVLFKHTLDLAYDTTSTSTTGAKAYVFAFMLLAAECQHEWNTGPGVDVQDCESKVALLVPHLIGEPDVSSAQTFLMLTVYYLFRGREEQGLIYHGIACRHLFSLGAHVHSVHRSERAGSSEEGVFRLSRQHLRRLFWLAYWSDGELSLRTGRPPAIDDDYCDLTIPTEPDDDESGESGITVELDPRFPYGGVGFGAADLQLALIRSQVGKGLYSASALRKTDAETLRVVRELDGKLEEWRVSMPPEERPMLYRERDYPPFDDPTINLHVRIRRITRQLHYLHLVAVIHQASSRCRRWTQTEGGTDELRGLSSSIAISLHASRATLIHVNLALDSLGTVRGMLFYPIAAALNIFCNILLDPLGPSVAEDLTLISSASELVKELIQRSSGGRDAPWFPCLNTFIVELARLGHSSVNLAKNGSAHV